LEQVHEYNKCAIQSKATEGIIFFSLLTQGAQKTEAFRGSQQHMTILIDTHHPKSMVLKQPSFLPSFAN
jgi:hypothetical protein